MSVSKLNPYINYKGQAKEAMEFYKSCLGGTLTSNTFKEGGMSHGPETDNLIMHSELITDIGMTIMGSDVPPDMDTGAFAEPQSVGLSIGGDNTEELQGYWDKLTVDGKVTMPYNMAPWGDTFGMFTDKFGINWMINCAGKKA
ncbi:VOC family protein [soil metagenome]